MLERLSNERDGCQDEQDEVWVEADSDNLMPGDLVRLSEKPDEKKVVAFLCRDKDGVWEVFTIDPEPFVLMTAEILLP